MIGPCLRRGWLLQATPLGVGIWSGAAKPAVIRRPSVRFFSTPNTQLTRFSGSPLGQTHLYRPILRPKVSPVSPIVRPLGLPFAARRGAAFWKVGTNIRIFRQMLKDSGDSEWKYRLLLFLGIFIVLNFLFNIMMAVLTNIYLERLQPSSHRFGMLVNSEYKHGIVEEMIKNAEKPANRDYLKCLRMLARDNGLINEFTDRKEDKKYEGEDAYDGYDINQIIMDEEQLDKWYYDKRDMNYIAAYVDLVLRYALTLPEQQSARTYDSICKALDLADHYGKLARQPLGTYTLKNRALRTRAEILQFRKAPFAQVEADYLDAIRIVENNEFNGTYKPDRDVAIVPPGEYSSDNLMNSLLDLCKFYSDTRDQKYMSETLSILVAELRSLETECKGLDRRYDSKAMSTDRKAVSTDDEKRLMKLKFEKIPLVKMETSEVLWYGKQYDKAIELAQDSAQQSSLYSKSNFNSAKIAKLGFQNLSKMYAQEGDSETSRLCQQKSDSIEIPMNAFMRPSRSVRDAVLEYWFGQWGKFLFPG